MAENKKKMMDQDISHQEILDQGEGQSHPCVGEFTVVLRWHGWQGRV